MKGSMEIIAKLKQGIRALTVWAIGIEGTEMGQKFYNTLSESDKLFVRACPELFYLDMYDFNVPPESLKFIEKKYNKLDFKKFEPYKEYIYKVIDLNIDRLRRAAKKFTTPMDQLLSNETFLSEDIIQKLGLGSWTTGREVYNKIKGNWLDMKDVEQDICKHLMLERLNESLDKKLNIKYKSWRWIPLITQSAPMRMLTVEDYCKWYDYYIIEGDKVKSLLHSYDEDKMFQLLDENLFSHCISPKGFLMAAQAIQAKVDKATYNAVIDMFIEEYYDEKPGSMQIEDYYLPSEELKKEILLD